MFFTGSSYVVSMDCICLFVVVCDSWVGREFFVVFQYYWSPHLGIFCTVFGIIVLVKPTV